MNVVRPAHASDILTSSARQHLTQSKTVLPKDVRHLVPQNAGARLWMPRLTWSKADPKLHHGAVLQVRARPCGIGLLVVRYSFWFFASTLLC